MTLLEEEKNLLVILLRMLNKDYSIKIKKKIYAAVEATRSTIRHLNA
jgi:hypothetical protein